MQNPPSEDRAPRVTLAVVLLAGAALRVAMHATCRSLWLDEAMLAVNIASRSFAGLLKALDYQQAAPLLYLWIERVCFLAGLALDAPLEWALRAFPLAAGLALLALLPGVAGRLVGSAAVLPAAVLAALSPTLVRYAEEAKPYGSDAFVTTLLLAALVHLREAPGAKGRWGLFAAAGLFAVLTSFPGVFVAVSVIAFGLLDARLRPEARRLAVVAALWGTVAAGTYAGVYQAEARASRQDEIWADAFLDPGPEWLARARYALPGVFLPAFLGDGTSAPPVPAAAFAVLALVLACGLAVVVRRAGAAASALFGGPLLLAAAASALRRYPFGVPRLMVFAAPLLILLAAAALGELLSRVPSLTRRAAYAVLLVGAVLGPGAWARLSRPFLGEEARPLVDFYYAKRRLDEPVYVAASGQPSWLFYTTNWREPNEGRIRFFVDADQGSGPIFEPSAGAGRNAVLAVKQHDELLGRYPGRQWRWRRGYVTNADPAWPAAEAARIADAALPCAWVYATRLNDRTFKPLTWHIRDTHKGVRQAELMAAGGIVIRYCFPTKPAR